MQRLFTYSILLVCTLQSLAQLGYYNEALLFSQSGFGGSSRIRGIGGAQIALGGDLSVANANPAGLGFYNRGTFTFSMELDNYQNDANYFGQNVSSGKSNFLVNQMGLLFYYGNGSLAIDDFRGGSLAITLNKVNDFHNSVKYEGYNDYNSLINSVIDNPSSNLAGAAYENFMANEHPWNYVFDEDLGEILGYDTIAGFAGLSSPFDASVPRQKGLIETYGGQYSIDIAYGGNYGDFLYFGGGLGIQALNYEKVTTYIEDDYFVVTERDGGEISAGFPEDALSDIYLKDQLAIVGLGINVNAGIILRPVSFMTIGIAYQSPTIMSLEEDSKFDFNTYYYDKYDYTVATFDDTDQDNDPTTRFVYTTYDLGTHEYLSDVYSSSYTLRTPSKLNVGAAVFLGKVGFLTGDVEFVNYSNSKLSSNEIRMGDDNRAIETFYTSVINYRLGAEIRLNQLRFRGGYAYRADPYQDDRDRSQNLISGGFGFKNKKFFADISGEYRTQNGAISPYSLTFDQPVADVSLSQISTTLTVGLTF